MLLASLAALITLGASGPASASVGYFESTTQTIDSGRSLNAISCIESAASCVAADSQGKLFFTTGASATATATWSPWNGPGASPGDALACPSSTLCLLAAGDVGDGGGNMYRTASLGGSFLTSFKPAHGVNTISCPTTSFCVASASSGGFIRYTTNPSGIVWSAVEVGSGAMTGVSCLSADFCALVDDSGKVYVATSEEKIKEAAGVGWTVSDIDGSTALRGIACTSTSSCLAVDGAGQVIAIAVGADGSASATRHSVPGANELSAVSCSGSTCALGDRSGAIFGSSDGGGDWTVRGGGSGVLGVSCSSASLCAAVTSAGEVTTFNPATTVPPLSILTDSLPEGRAGNAYAATASADGGEAPYHWSATGLPPGLSIDATSGQISGAPTTATCVTSSCPQPPTTYTPTLVVTDDNGTEATMPLTLAVAGTDVSLEVTGAGEGSGEVSSDPIGIDRCGSSSGRCRASFEDTTTVTLTARPAAGSSFEGWSGGGCTGTGACRTRLTADTRVTATFAKAPPAVLSRTPRTRITKAAFSPRGMATFRFKATGGNRFECALSRAGHAAPRFVACSSPRVFRHLQPGRYLFRVRALGPGGVDPTPASRRFRVRP